MNINTKIERCFDNYLLKHNNFKMLVLLSASMVIKECEKFIPDGELSNFPEGKDTALCFLNEHVNWAQHGFINALQSHVELIYAYQESVINQELQIGPDLDEAMLITRCLRIYQKWKDDIVRREKAVHGEQWGDGGGFNNVKWDENNEKFLMLYK